MRLQSLLISTVGTWRYDSKVWKRAERLPVVAGLMSVSRSDGQSLVLVREFLEESNLPSVFETGREMFGQYTRVRDSYLEALGSSCDR